MLNRISVYFLTLCTLPLLLHAQNTFYTANGYACVGQKIVMKCYVQPPTEEHFYVTVPLISFDLSEPYTMDQINSNSVPNTDTSRYHIEPLTAGNFRIGASITINDFAAADSNILFGCYGRYINGTNTEELTNGFPPPTAAPPTQILTVHSNVLSISYGCFADVSVYFLVPASDSPIQHYEMSLNGIFYSNLDNKTSFFNPALVSISVDPATNYKISVAAVSCAGTASASQEDGSFSIPSYELDSAYVTLDYFNNLHLSWTFKEDSATTIAIGYRLKVDTSFTLDIRDENFILNQSLTLSQPSDQTTYSHDLGLSVINENRVSLDIRVKLEIISQCYDSSYPANAVTTEDSDELSHVPPINIPNKTSWVLITALGVGLGVCSLSNIVAILCAVNECSRRRSAMRRQGYISFAQGNANEAMQPLISREEPARPAPIAPGYSVNTAERLPNY